MLADTKKVNPNHIELNNYTENKVIILGIQIEFSRLAMFFFGGGRGSIPKKVTILDNEKEWRAIIL